ncbi:MAG: HK97 family phage prohead protease [Treponemataceae bacterium]|nr:HK97 family phage prohead protease [Treponemataceae bacterium]
MIRVRTKDREFTAHDGSVLRGFLRSMCGKDGRLTDEVLIRCMVPFRKEKAEDGQESFRWTFSSYDVDRCLERVDPEGWELENYRSNPVVLWAHDAAIPAIGYAVDVDKGKDLSGRVVFNEKEFDQFGWSIGQRVKFGSIRSGSVGFLVKEVEFVDHREKPEEKADLIFRRQELLEFSICNVPANPLALMKEASAGAEKSADVERRFYFTGKGGIIEQRENR